MAQLPNAVYSEVVRAFGGVSDLPAGVYTAHAMSTSLKTIVTPDTGAWAGRRNPRLKQIIASSGSFIGYRDAFHRNHRIVSFPLGVTTRNLLGGSSNLPAGSYTAHSMSTSRKIIVTPDIGAWIGRRQFRFVLAFDSSISCTVAGNIGLSIALPQAPGCTVAGVIALTFGALTGISSVLGSATCIGIVAVKFQPVSTYTCNVQGNIDVQFLQGNGQQEICISGPDTPNLSESNPKNAVF